MPINVNPIFNNKYLWKNLELTISDNFKHIIIDRGDVSIEVSGNFFADVMKVLEKALPESPDPNLTRYNLVPTSWSLPIAKNE